MGEINWEAQERAMKGIKSPETIRRILWGENLMRVKLRQQGKCASGCCLLGGEKDMALHFLVCGEIVGSKEWKSEGLRFQQKAEK